MRNSSVEPAENARFATATTAASGSAQASDARLARTEWHAHEHANAPASDNAAHTGCKAAMASTMAQARYVNAAAGWYVENAFPTPCYSPSPEDRTNFQTTESPSESVRRLLPTLGSEPLTKYFHPLLDPCARSARPPMLCTYTLPNPAL